MEQKPIGLTGRRAPPAGRLRNAPWPLASASMTDGRRKMHMPPHFHEKRRRKAFSLRHCCHYSNLFGEEFNRFSCSSLFHQVHTVAFM